MEPIKVIYGFDISPCSSPGSIGYSSDFSDDLNPIKHSMLSIELHHAKPTAMLEKNDKNLNDVSPEIKVKSEFVNYVFGSQPICILGKRRY